MERSVLKIKIESLKDDLKSLEDVLNPIATKEKIQKLIGVSLDASFWNDQKNAKSVIDETNDLKEKVALYDSLTKDLETLSFILSLSEEDEETLKEADKVVSHFASDYKILENALLLSDPLDKLNAIMDIHSGAGGTESLDWCSMLFRMYQMYAQKKRFKVTILNFQEGDEAGVKNVTMRIEGHYAFGYLKSESGIHRLVRLSPFDSSNKRHTTFASVLVTPEIEDDINIEIKDTDLKIDVFHSSGAGGQGVNTTDSAVRITHIPTKIVITCQNERSQIQNKATAMSILKSRLYQIETEKRKAEMDKLSDKPQIAFGSQIRSYVFHPYTLVKDHRTNFETSQGDKVMNGDIEDFIDAYLRMKGKE